MDPKEKLYNDILKAISLIDDFLGPINLFEEYVVDLKTKSAIERQLAIIGEAVKRIKEIDPLELIEYHQEIIGFRNILVHNYDGVVDRVVWSIIKDHLVSLKENIVLKFE